MLEKLIAIAESQVGVREIGGNNRGDQIREYQKATDLAPGAWPWCAAWTDWCIKEWLEDSQVVKWLNLKNRTPEEWRPKTALAYGLTAWAKKRPNTTRIFTEKDKAKLGDIVTFDFSHVGFVVSDNGVWIETLEGNALPLTSKVLTPRGFKLMKDIKVGDEVIDPDGESSFVTGVFPQGSRDLYKIKLQDGAEAISCDQHLWKIQIDGRKDKVLNTIDLKKRVNSKAPRSRIPQIQPVNFSFNDNLPIEPYLMGLLIGEGGMSSDYLGFTNIDDEIINHVKNNLVSGHILKPHIENENTVRGNYRIISESKKKNEMIRILKELNLQGKKSFEKFIPEIYKNSSIENRLSLLQGLMDSDGSVDKIGRCDFSSSSRQLSEDVMDVIRSLGGRCALNVKTNIFYTSPNQKTPKQARDCYRLQNINMPFFNVFRLKRKVDRFKFRNASWARKIVSVEPCGIGEVQCISVSAKSNLFITDNYIPTHNTNGKGERDSESGDGVWRKIRKKTLVKDLIRINPSGSINK
jgi:hypothetical protein